MRKLFMLAAGIAAFATVAQAGDVWVRPHLNGGSYVPGYHRTTPDRNPWNNYGTMGNPWTGAPGRMPTPTLQYPRGNTWGYGQRRY